MRVCVCACHQYRDSVLCELAGCTTPGQDGLVQGNLLHLCYAVTVFPLMVIMALYMALPLPELAWNNMCFPSLKTSMPPGDVRPFCPVANNGEAARVYGPVMDVEVA